MGEVPSVLHAPLSLCQLSVLLTISCSLSTVISSPCVLLLSLLKPWPRPFYTPGKSERVQAGSGREVCLRHCAVHPVWK